MTSWRTDRPQGRIFALVLWKHSYHPIPLVMQYDPGFDTWTDNTPGRYQERYPHDQVEWTPFPQHPRFSSRTHAMEET